MNCSEAKNLLSAYYDGELPADERSQVAQHLDQCADCSHELECFVKLSGLTQESDQDVSAKGQWLGIVEGLESNREEFHGVTPDKRESISAFTSPRALATAAILLVAVGIAWISFPNESHHAHDHDEFTYEFGHYLDEFQRDPEAAQRFLLAKYENSFIDAEGAAEQLGYRPVVADGLPDEYSMKSTYVLKMPCCTCVQCLCQREDGTTIAIFEHDDEETKEWFGDRPEKSVECEGKQCCMIELDDRVAASWKIEKRYVTVIGLRDEAELTQLVAWFERRRKSLLKTDEA